MPWRHTVFKFCNCKCADARFRNDSCASLNNSTDVCAEWVYEDPHSFVAEFHLACEEWKRTLVGTAQAFGYGVGLLIVGPLSDRLGRKTVIIITGTMAGILGVAKSLSNSYWFFIVLEFLGSALGNYNSPAYILSMEMVAHEKRVLLNTVCILGRTVIDMFVPLMAWQLSYWRYLLLVYYSPAIIFITFIFLLDESPRWLLSKGKKDEAIEVLKKAAKSCNTKLNNTVLDNLTFEQHEEATLKATFTSKILLKRFFICVILWTVIVFANYGIRINSVLLPGNKYVNFGLLGVATVSARLLAFWLLKKFTRKISLTITFLLCAVVYFVQPFMPGNEQWLSILLFMTGMLLARIYFCVIYIFTSELFPTCTRNSIHALCSSLSRVGSILAPQTPLLIVYWHGLPSLTFGAASLIGGTVALFAPSTADGILPDNVNQAELIGQKQKNKSDVTQNINLPEMTEREGPGVYTIKFCTY